jgi:hypothetical protein
MESSGSGTTREGPEQGQLAEVRQQRYVIADVIRSSVVPGNGRAQHLVSLASIEDDALGEELQVVWELEPSARIVEKVALPDHSRDSMTLSASIAS